MKLDSQKIRTFSICCAIGVLIILSPIIITGRLYNENKIMGGLLISEFVMRTSCFMIGLLVIYDAIKTHFK
ncbi:hypothetical protein [Fonticella tunisiensis]|uniref:Uncharacterized protein n=1 Tax=Fonticella tunisiensis TaxID=1096341 RepID=A0A4V3EUP0_9CLOT|nr:hypothetical protein [Fonticella tunisiensis]TDT58368.1 hypothetical protein EDD71_1111 [Fonticella tunisiensis]